MLDRPGRQVGAHADIAGPDRVLADVVKAIAADRASGVSARIGQAVVFLALTPTEGRPGGHAVGQVELAAHRAKQLLLVRIGPVLREILVGRRGVRDGGPRRHAGTRRIDAVVLPAQVGREAGALAPAVQPLAVLVLHRALAVAADQVQARAPFFLGAEATGQIGRGVDLVIARHPCRQARQGFAGALGRQVEGAAYARPARRGAVQEGAGAAEHLDPLDQFGRHELARQHAVQAVVAHVVREDREAPDHIQLLEIAEALGHPHRRIVLQHVADAARLLIADQFLGVVAGRIGRVHHVHIAQQADPAASRHLPAGIGRGQSHLRSRHDDLVQFGRRGRRRLLGQGGRGDGKGQQAGGAGETAGRAGHDLQNILKIREWRLHTPRCDCFAMANAFSWPRVLPHPTCN